MQSPNFFALLRYALGTGDILPTMTFAEIQEVYNVAKKQSLVALLYAAMEKGNIRPTDVHDHEDEFEELLMEWLGERVKTARRNGIINRDVAEVTRWLDSKGFECCLLKGQGNALLYSDSSIRTPGDIDLWIRSKERMSVEEDSRKIIDLVRRHSKGEWCALYHHAEGLDWKGTPVELHYRPRFMLNLINNARLQRYFRSHEDKEFHNFVMIGGEKIAMPTAEFNVVFQLCHILEHVMHEGIGLRQIVDYYYVLKKLDSKSLAPNPSPEGRGGEKHEFGQLLHCLGLHQIAGAVMWILVTQLGMSRDRMIAKPDERRGRFMLHEILLGGNFGHFDHRNVRFGNNQLGKNVQRIIRDIRLVRYFPSEALSEPFFRLWHAWWRWRHN